MNTLSSFRSRVTDKVGIALLALFVLISVASFYQVANGRVNDFSDLIIEQAAAVDNVQVHLILPSLSAATSTILVDKSDTTNFPHEAVGLGNIEVQQILVDWSSNAVASTTLQFGVVASSTANYNKADIYWFASVRFSTGDNGSLGAFSQTKVFEYAPSALSLALSSGMPTRFLSNEKDLMSSLYSTSTQLTSPRGNGNSVTVNPAAGDLVMRVFEQNGSATTSVSVLYRIR